MSAVSVSSSFSASPAMPCGTCLPSFLPHSKTVAWMRTPSFFPHDEADWGGWGGSCSITPFCMLGPSLGLLLRWIEEATPSAGPPRLPPPPSPSWQAKEWAGSARQWVEEGKRHATSKGRTSQRRGPGRRTAADGLRVWRWGTEDAWGVASLPCCATYSCGGSSGSFFFLLLFGCGWTGAAFPARTPATEGQSNAVGRRE